MSDFFRQARYAAYKRQIESIINEVGWAVQGVFSTPDHPGPSFAYTIGLTAKGHPELIMSGLPLKYLQGWLNIFAEKALNSPFGFAPGQRIDLSDKKSFIVIEAPAAEVGIAELVYARPIRVLQLVWHDKKGRWPTDPDYDDPPQNLFGPFEEPKP